MCNVKYRDIKKMSHAKSLTTLNSEVIENCIII
jgi:hypothetical protein